MTIINHSHGFIFVHIPKAAGTSVTSVLSPHTQYCDLELGGTAFGEAIQGPYQRRFGLSKHSPARNIKNVVGAVTWAKYFSFTFVRNPFARCLSIYNFLRQWPSPDQAFTERMRSFRSFDEFVLSDLWDATNGPDEIFRPQVFWLRATLQSNQLLTDFIGHVESIEQDLESVLRMAGLNKALQRGLAVPRLNRSAPQAPQTDWSAAVVERIRARFKTDFELLGYAVDPAHAQPLPRPAA